MLSQPEAPRAAEESPSGFDASEPTRIGPPLSLDHDAPDALVPFDSTPASRPVPMPARPALRRPGTVPLSRDPSSGRLIAAQPSVPRAPLPVGRAPSNPEPPGPPARSEPVVRAVLPSLPDAGASRGEGSASVQTAPGPAAGPPTIPAPPVGTGPEFVISVVQRDGAASSGSVRAASPSHLDVPLTRRCTACDTRYPADFLVCPRDASPLVDESGDGLADPLLGKLLGETYQIIRVVGEGGMGRVYEARHLRLKERRFAVKTLHSDLAKNHEIVARFMREAESASSLSHPNVVDVFDVHHLADGTPYLVGEFLDGEELADFVTHRGPLEPKMAAAVGRQVCRALSAAHARGIVHRDMKPENIYVLRSSIDALAAGEVHAVTVKVLDFGISKTGDSERTHLTRTGVIMGTPSYMAPEQARGKQVDLRADVYSTGAVLYYALTGKRPFDSEDPTSTISMVLTQDPPRPRSFQPRIPEALELIVQRAMAKEARDRFQTMAELEKALATFEEGGRALAVQGRAPSDAPLDVQASSAHRAFDLAKRMLVGPSSPPGPSSSLARVARPTIVITSAALGLWLVGGMTAALAGLVRVLHDGEITLTECVLLVVGCLFAAATPIALYILHVRRTIWPNSVRALQLAGDLKRTATAALVTYGAASIAARILSTVLWRASTSIASGVWDILLFAVSVVAALTVGGFAPLVRNMRRRRSPSDGAMSDPEPGLCPFCAAALPAAFPGATVRCGCGQDTELPRRGSVAGSGDRAYAVDPAGPLAGTPYRSAAIQASSAPGAALCPYCSGECPAFVRICPHCDVRLEKVRCPRCFTLQGPGSVACARCGRGLALEPLFDATEAPCPRCLGRLESAPGGDGRFHECPRCGGMFVPRTLLAEILRDAEAAGAVSAASAGDASAALGSRRSDPRGGGGLHVTAIPPLDQVRYVRCPLCHAAMNRVNFGRVSGVIVDVCKVHGTWFDAGELTRVAGFAASGAFGDRHEREAPGPETPRHARVPSPTTMAIELSPLEVWREYLRRIFG